MKYRLILALLLILAISCKSEDQNVHYQIVYQNDKAGNAILGSKENLIAHIRGGADIKIGWGSKGKTRRIEHLSEPLWISVLNEKEVIAQLDPHYTATTDWNTLTSTFSDSLEVNIEWRVVLSTKGEFDAIWYDKHKGTLVRRVPQKHAMTWFAKGNIKDEPLFLVEKE